MASMADLADAAAQLPPSDAFDLANAGPQKRKRSSKLEVARKVVDSTRASLEKAQGKMLLAQSARGTSGSAKQKGLSALVEKVAKFQETLKKSEAKVVELQTAAPWAGAATEAKRVMAEEKAESSKTLSELALITIVTLRIKY